MNIYNIEFLTIENKISSGGEFAMINIIKEFSKDINNNLILYTSSVGKIVYDNIFNNIKNIKIIGIGDQKKIIFLRKFGKVGVFFIYFYLMLESFYFLFKVDSKEKNLVITHSDFWPNMIFSYFLKKKNENFIVWSPILHMRSPNLFKGFKYNFVKNKIVLPNFNLIHYYLNQKIFFRLIKKADFIMTVNDSYIDYIKKFNKNVLLINLAADSYFYKNQIISTSFDEKKYDACFIGRFHEQKGIFEIPYIVKYIVDLGYNNFKMAIVGDYNNSIGCKVIEMIKQFELDKNIEFLGFKTNLDKYNIINDSKFLFFPSYYESFGIVYLEAISLGVPVFEYDLPIYNMHCNGAIKIKFLDNKEWAIKFMDIINNKDLYYNISEKASDYSKNFSWDITVDNIFENAKKYF